MLQQIRRLDCEVFFDKNRLLFLREKLYLDVKYTVLCILSSILIGIDFLPISIENKNAKDTANF